MPTLIGVDEAGYGPNLGPLIVAATRWEIDDEALLDEDALIEALAPAIQSEPTRGKTDRIAIADSKQLYSPGGGLAELERGVLAALRLGGASIDCWRDLWPAVAPHSQSDLAEAPWRADYDEPLPIDASSDDIDDAAEVLKTQLQAAGVRLLEVRAAPVFPRQFNQLVEQHGNKASALSITSLQLARTLLPVDDDAQAERVLVHCDKHGGRKRYAPLLQELYPDRLARTLKETAQESVYATGPGNRTTVRFVAKGDRFLPAALASMVAKYLRELAMRAFNAYWVIHSPGVKPTAGYPQDAKRFKRDIAAAQARLEIDDDDLWRNR